MRLSILVPVLNEAHLIDAFLAHVRCAAPDAELVVVDGGSTDDTAERAARHTQVITSPEGRARQMNAGAAAATGDLLWFLHVDSRLPDGAVAAIEEAMGEREVAGGCFRLRIPERHLVYRWNDVVGNLGVDLFGMACGDHGIFVRRTVFEAVGGYPEVTLLEDLEFYRRARAYGRMRQLAPAITTSARRWQRHGLYRTTAVYTAILALYCCGAPLPWLTALYARLR
jgi:rSAM/selenodomain-associated transferase 2